MGWKVNRRVIGILSLLVRPVQNSAQAEITISCVPEPSAEFCGGWKKASTLTIQNYETVKKTSLEIIAYTKAVSFEIKMMNLP